MLPDAVQSAGDLSLASNGGGDKPNTIHNMLIVNKDRLFLGTLVIIVSVYEIV